VLQSGANQSVNGRLLSRFSRTVALNLLSITQVVFVCFKPADVK